MSSLIGKGSYSCVYRPPLPCCNTTQYNDNMVGKLVSAEQSASELSSVEYINSIDPQYQYHVGAKYKCDICDIPLDDCTRHRHINTPYQIISDYGGISISEYLSSHQQYHKKLLVGLINIFDAIIHMRNHNFYHLDININNIVVLDHGDRVSVRLIDFGLSKHIDNYNIYVPLFDNVYLYWPPETILLSGKILYVPVIKAYLRNFFSDSYIRRIPSVRETTSDELYETIGNYEMLSRELLNMQIYNSIDSYSLGTTLLIINERIRNDKLNDLIYYMTHIDLNKRIDIVEARGRYINIVASL